MVVGKLSIWSEFNRNIKESAIKALVRRFNHGSFLHWNLNPIIWNDIDNTTKSALLTALFRKHPGEPFQSPADFCKTLEYLAMGIRRSNRLPAIPSRATCTDYIPAPEVDHLRNIMREAGDDTWLARVDDMISRREVACRRMTPQAQRLPYVP